MNIGLAHLPSFGDPQDMILDLDSHAYMAVLGSNAYVVEDTGGTVDVLSEARFEERSHLWLFCYNDPSTVGVVLLLFKS